VMAVLQWTRGQADRRALIAVAVFAFVAAALGLVNRWPRFAVNLNTAEPIASQIAIAVAGALFAAALLALLAGLMAGVGAWAAARQRTMPSDNRMRPWIAGTSAALLVMGAGALVMSFVPKMEPLWPSYELEATWLPSFAALLEGLQVVVSGGIAVFALHWIDGVAQRFTRRRVLALVLIVMIAAAAAVALGRGALPAFAAVVEGLVLLFAIYVVLRVDYCAAPPFVATGVVLHAIETAAQKGTPQVWIYAGLTIAGAVVAAFVVIAYIERARLSAIQST
jgi:hypothetical protein